MALQLLPTTPRQYLKCTTPKPLDITGELTISSFVNVLDKNVIHYILSKTDQYYFILNVNKLRFQYYDTDDILHSLDSDSFQVLDCFYLFTITWKQPKVKFYINGEFLSEATSDFAICSGNENVYISSQSSGETNMIVEDVRVYNRQLNIDEIANIWNKKGLDDITNGLVCRLKLNEYPEETIATNTITDVSGYNLVFTPYNNPVYKKGVILSGNNNILDFVNWYQTNPIENYFNWKTYSVEYESGITERRKVWNRPRRRWKLNFTPMKQPERDKLIEFFNSVGQGSGQSFLIKDRYDYTGVSKFIGDGTTTSFQLYKSYYSQSWREYKQDIIPGSVIVKIHGEQITSGFTVSYTTGLVVFDTPPENLIDIEVEFEFYYRVVFANDELLDRKVAPSLWEYEQLEVIEVK